MRVSVQVGADGLLTAVIEGYRGQPPEPIGRVVGDLVVDVLHGHGLVAASALLDDMEPAAAALVVGAPAESYVAPAPASRADHVIERGGASWLNR